MATRRVSGVTGNVPGPREGSGGPPGGATSPGGPYGLYVERDQPLSGLGASPLGPMRLGFGGTLKGGCPLALGGQGNSPGRRPLLRLDLRGPAPLSLAPIYMWGVGGQPQHKFWRSPPPLPSTPPLPRCLAKPCRRTVTPPPPRRRAAVGAFFLNLSLLLAGSRRGRRHRSVRVLNAEVSSVRH